MTEEDESFNEIERRSIAKKDAVRAAIAINPYRDQVIEEVAQHFEKLAGHADTKTDAHLVCVLAEYIREMKK
jgi:hypothetical protein